MMTGRAVLFVGLAGAVLAMPVREPSGVEFEVTSVEDSASYYVYRYQVVNPSQSRGGLTTIAMNISATAGTPPLLATSGTFFDLSGGDQPSHAEVGVDVPSGWVGMLTVDPEVIWELPSEWNTSPDSVAPGGTASGFTLRSSYLPGLRRMHYGPTVEACCLTPTDTSEEVWAGMPIDFEVPGWSIGPRYTPDQVTVELLVSQTETVCRDPLWVQSSSVCDALLNEARSAARENPGSAQDRALASFERLLAQNLTVMHRNVRWLLGTNARVLREVIPR